MLSHPTVMASPQPPPGDLEVLASWAPELADAFVTLACDIALVIDADGRICNLAQRDERPIAPRTWAGRLWTQTVEADSRSKVEQMLADVDRNGTAPRREINHRAKGGGTAPVAYCAARLGAGGPTLAVGQDLRGQAVLQQRFVAAQEALERSYWNAQRRLREPPADGMTEQEKETLGLEAFVAPTTRDLDDSELVRALARLVDRIDHDTLPGLLRDARRLAETHFIAHALSRAGSVDALAHRLGVSRRSLTRRRRFRSTT